MKEKTINKVTLSASKIKLFDECSFKYYCRYILKLPDTPNSGSSRGSVTHYVLECLLHPRHHKTAEKIIKDGTISNSPSVLRLATVHAKKLNVADEENFALIDKFILSALNYDFFCKGASKVIGEQKFDIETETYKILGFVDKTAYYPDGSIKVIDYKTSKARYDKNYMNYCIQALMYSLAEYIRTGTIPTVDFLFLKFRDPLQQAPTYTEGQLKNFEEYLAYLTTYLSDFSFQKAVSNLAASDFKHRWACGKKLGELTKEGKEFYCPYRFSKFYFALLDENGGVVKTSYVKKDLDAALKPGYSIESKEFAGCPAWRNEFQ